jgi:type VI secretion system protein ImpF
VAINKPWGGASQSGHRSHQNSNNKDRLQPALLDRLTDTEPHKTTERPEAHYVDEARLKQALLRDLQWLLNTTNASGDIDFDGLAAAELSVVNYGMPALTGQMLSELDWNTVQASIRRSILQFEPRILPKTLSITQIQSAHAMNQHNTLQFEIRCEFWSLPFSQELLLKARLDVETGQVAFGQATDSSVPSKL